MKISDSEFNGRPYKISSKKDGKIYITIIDKTFKHSFNTTVEPDGKDALFYTPDGLQKRHYKLITHDINLPKSEVRKLKSTN